jgi:phosphoglycolate phosphatase
LGVATGKSRRGLDILLDKHGLRDYFITAQCADVHPSKPHPAMLQAALAETGIAAKNAVMIGDTQFDMEMAGAAGVHAIGVTWGYHEVDRLVCADYIANDFVQIPSILNTLWQDAA